MKNLKLDIYNEVMDNEVVSFNFLKKKYMTEDVESVNEILKAIGVLHEKKKLDVKFGEDDTILYKYSLSTRM